MDSVLFHNVHYRLQKWSYQKLLDQIYAVLIIVAVYDIRFTSLNNLFGVRENTSGCRLFAFTFYNNRY
ncbi:MAG: hypothetical protein ACI9QN_001344 [Arcticibacterium sp.]|jgi:hypothetical protein